MGLWDSGTLRPSLKSCAKRTLLFTFQFSVFTSHNQPNLVIVGFISQPQDTSIYNKKTTLKRESLELGYLDSNQE